MQTQIAGNTSGALAYFFLNAAVGDESIRLVSPSLAKALHKEAFGYGTANGHYMTLSQRTAAVFHSFARVQLRVARCGGTPQTELLKLVDGIKSAHAQHRVEHRRHVARVQEEAVARYPQRIARIIDQEF